ncbi:hypothetical protein [Xanthomonas phaseoli]|uniref:Uncharacterized protein n=1 Tax=Xanthomonas phaseoli pv. dieffenbachiae TaxID=92828 RepID=A0A1V9H6V3_9XANT|nr:hypothetical protein [Xanthomonas phaseoli]MBO9789015.1 hypothetical protein [Xanthomonas phaseoli pv. dieffenbachiae]MBO9833793.1 hypothetical protein [Xanthomonas phaseoli pv. dieffenbachiae]MBO9838535.1 hypothetical protein [Xanthomonas phaseoli pv. dieffenbachiae]MBO9840186.1 hypothetical protein [Xanthomonas phaseoli pv. dieffenbachiae]MBO9854987.1 hypothetical protein [Xanthomonas phaseoli pv. dieffenbachiae]
MREAGDAGVPFELIIDGDYIATEPFPGLGVNWTFKVYPEQLRERAQEVVRYTARQAIVEISDAMWRYALASDLKRSDESEPAVVLLRALRNAYAHRRDDWAFGKAELPLRWRQLDLVPGMQGLPVSETIFLNEQLLLINDAIYLLDPDSTLTRQVHR